MPGTDTVRPQRDRRTWWRAMLFTTLLVSAAVASVAGVGQVAAMQGDDKPVATFNATGTEGFVAIDAGSPDDPIAFPTPDETEQPISLSAEVFRNGTWRSTDVSFPDLGEEQLGFDVEIRIDAPRPFWGTINRETGGMTVDATLDITVPTANCSLCGGGNGERLRSVPTDRGK